MARRGSTGHCPEIYTRVTLRFTTARATQSTVAGGTGGMGGAGGWLDGEAGVCEPITA